MAMATRSSKRQRTQRGISDDAAASSGSPAPAAPAVPRTFPHAASNAATDKDRESWKGWCEIESEPALFNVMLRQFGVRGVKVREIFSLDNEMLDLLPRPIYGLIFLFKWREDDPAKQETTCPPNVWFANQTVANACASVALLNIVNNGPDVDLGDHLRSFKEFTADMPPAARGYAIGNFEFIKRIHNSFARKMDMLNADLLMKHDVADSKKKRKRKSTEDDPSDAAFHFIAFVPVDGTVWKLDGLERQPHKVGAVESDDWIQQVKPDLQARMAEYEEGQIDFAILSLVNDPLIRLCEELASNVKSLQSLSAHLDKEEPEWQAISDSLTGGEDAATAGTLFGADTDYLVTAEAIANASISTDTQQKLADSTVEALLQHRQSLISAQKKLRLSIKEEQGSNRSDEEKAAERRHDYGPAVQAWLRFHAQKSVMKTILSSC